MSWRARVAFKGTSLWESEAYSVVRLDERIIDGDDPDSTMFNPADTIS